MKRNNSIRQSAAVSAVLLLALFLLPRAMVAPFQEDAPPQNVPEEEPRTESVPFESGSNDAAVVLRVLNGDHVETMDLGTYLLGVVRAEMPASFQQEALNAQAVAARTYTLYHIRNGGSHGETADICTDSTCCQAYLSEEAARAGWGSDADACEGKIETAVAVTDGQTILYEGDPVLAVFHSSSAGLTRAAGEVWLEDLPYLQAVESPESSEQIPDYYSRVEFTAEQFRERFLSVYPQARLSGGVDGWLGDAKTDAAGSVDSLSVGGITVKGSELRAILGLRSACFTWETQKDGLVFFVTGYGHGVGLSQYGANRMAAAGADYREILMHYYTGVTVGVCPQTPF